MHHFELLRPPVPPRRKRWEWSTVPAPPPFDPDCVVSVAVHPDGRTVFFVESDDDDDDEEDEENSRGGGGGTFSFDTKQAWWTRHGGWLLPFRGRGHFDAELGAWVGLCSRADSPGHLCSCDVVSPSPEPHADEPRWKLREERLFCDDKFHVGAELVYMGDSQFCVLEFLKGSSAKRKRNQEHRPPRRLLHVTAFGLKYASRESSRRRSAAGVAPP
ncbi:hypothetical protein E2562_000656 [Oryza meyeriana var. granulata]|uniref:DUF1618 domain-containing protein n=1 Tax=Oryza meyeriana var. granulata TaxID=110450 RepID=A0A6G1DU88_9ORYZ|nr:hypothetical protein E2562_000656 [Oryza meyeriana var. granulata]